MPLKKKTLLHTQINPILSVAALILQFSKFVTTPLDMSFYLPPLLNWNQFYSRSTNEFYSVLLKTVPRSVIDEKTVNTPRYILAPPLGLCTNPIGLALNCGRSYIIGFFCFYYQLFVGLGSILRCYNLQGIVSKSKTKQKTRTYILHLYLGLNNQRFIFNDLDVGKSVAL